MLLFSLRGKNKKHLLRLFRNVIFKDKECYQGAFMNDVQSWITKFWESLKVLYQKNEKFKHQLDRISRFNRQLVGEKYFCNAQIFSVSRNKETMLA